MIGGHTGHRLALPDCVRRPRTLLTWAFELALACDFIIAGPRPPTVRTDEEPWG